jgi:hypothetical protein
MFMIDLTMSLFYDKNKGLFSTEPKENINLQRLIQIYQSDFVKEKTQSLLSENISHLDKQELKKQLPFITPYSCSSYRSKENVFHLNSNIICLDFDNLYQKEARLLKHHLSQNESTILTAISPRQKGVKAIIHLPQIKDFGLMQLQNQNTHLTDLIETFDLQFNKPTKEAIEYHYYFQKHNLPAILSKLNISIEADVSQLKIVQPFLIAYDSDLYYNLETKPLQVELTHYVAQERPQIESKVETKDFSDRTQKRIAGFLRKKLDFICNDMRNSSQGTRHPQIARCIDILERLHYLPDIESEVIATLKNAITEMYGSENEANRSNAFRSFDAIFKNIVPRKCSKIEAIINGAEILAI